MSISNLTLQYISASFAGLMQYSSSGAIFDGLGNQITLLDVSASAGATAVSGAGTTLPGYPTLTLSSDGAYTIAVNAATTGLLSYSPVYKSSSFGVGIGAYLSASVAGAIGSIDGVALTTGNTILVKDQTAAWQNGVYIIVNSGSVSANYILSRSLNSDEPSELDPQVVIASAGTTNKGIPYGQVTRTPIISVDDIDYEQYKANFVTQAPTSAISKGLQGRTQAEYQIPWWTTVARELDPGTPKLKYVLTTTTSKTTISSLILTGSLIVSGSAEESSGSGHVLTYNTATGLITYTSSAALGGGGGETPDLQAVTTINATTTDTITVDDGAAVSTIAPGVISVLDKTNIGVTISNDATVVISPNGTNTATIQASGVNKNIVLEVPDKSSGTYTIATTDDISSAAVGGLNAIQVDDGSGSFTGSTSASIDPVRSTFILGGPANITGNSNAVIGNDNVGGSQISGSGVVAIGYDNQVTGSHSLAVGSGNRIFINSAYSPKTGFLVAGYNNQITLSGSNREQAFAIGVANKVYAPIAIAIGGSNEIVGSGSSAAIGLSLVASGSGQVVVGRYNAQGDSTSPFIVGIGTGSAGSARETGFKVTQSGSMVTKFNAFGGGAPTWTGSQGELVVGKGSGNAMLWLYVGTGGTNGWISASFSS